jgi:putative ABC transport system permease protein
MEGLQPFLMPGVIYGIGALGLAIIYRYLRFPDFTVIGSIVNGGICSVYFSNKLGFGSGIASAFSIGVLLGLFTGLLTTKLRIKPVLASIITFTGSFTLAELLTNGGVIALQHPENSWIAPVYSLGDLLILISCALLLCLLFAIFSATKPGVLVLAMTAEPKFLKFRHRSRNKTFIAMMALGNGIVSLAGGIYAVKERGANVPSHLDFLTLSLGGIFAANAVAVWLSKWLGDYEVKSDEVNNVKRSTPRNFLRRLPHISSAELEDPKHLFFLLVFYVIGCFFFLMLSRAIYAQIFFSVDSAYQHVVVSALLMFFVWWAGTEDE